jgi:ATP-dependent DNA ligase
MRDRHTNFCGVFRSATQPSSSARSAAQSQMHTSAAHPSIIGLPKPTREHQWLQEIKFDGYRMHARLDRGAVQLLTRTGLD